MMNLPGLPMPKMAPVKVAREVEDKSAPPPVDLSTPTSSTDSIRCEAGALSVSDPSANIRFVVSENTLRIGTLGTGKDKKERPDKEKHHKEHRSHRAIPQLHIAENPRIAKKIRWEELEIPKESDKANTLGKGAQGCVRRVKHKESGTYFALKSIQAAGGDRKTIFQELAAVASNLHSKCTYVCGSYEAFYKKGCLHILMEYMEYGSLLDVLNVVKQLDEESAAIISCHCLLGLRQLHNNELIHRDIKPSNLLVGGDGSVKIADFGVAKFVDTMHIANTSVGTQVFMSPERIQLTDYSFVSDVWSLGLSIAQCVLGYFPFKGESQFVLLNKISDGTAKVEFPPERNLSEDIQDFLRKTTIHDWKERPSAAELLKHPFITKYVENVDEPPHLHKLLDDYGAKIKQNMGIKKDQLTGTAAKGQAMSPASVTHVNVPV
eukprot:TRINITY_DN58585_c0_g1_i1.p1 TRINITY_DN58585_c0_g1~~TRINITY_DN58585_c0_g1_i1.p1  ORF type:complete len:435 (+),score=41.54 TRINITY_DN58585_c0_g1_i1:73-1377(+)